MTKRITSRNHVNAAFKKGHTAFMPYYTLGYPDQETSLDIIEACINNGADLMELGIPFSDPLADGPTIQHSTQIALQNGITVERCLQSVAELRSRGLEIPFMMMGYYNPILAYGIERFVTESHQVGADGFIIPDLPPEEAGPMMSLCEGMGLSLTFLLAPNSPPERIQEVVRVNTGFIYLVSVIGITGARNNLPEDLSNFIQRVRGYTEGPIAVGFGISNPTQARLVGDLADGVIVGSALIKATREAADPVRAAGDYIKAMVHATRSKQFA